MFADFAEGARRLFCGFEWLTRPGLKRHVVIPLLINIALFVCAIVFAADRFGTWLHHWISTMPGWIIWLASLLWLNFTLAAIVVLFYAFTLVANLIGAPFNSFSRLTWKPC